MTINTISLKDLWGDWKIEKVIHTPMTLLEEQALVISKKTNFRIKADIRISEIPISLASHLGMNRNHAHVRFAIYPIEIGKKVSKGLFSLISPIQPPYFPLQFSDGDSFYVINDISTLEHEISNILTSHENKQLIEKLLHPNID